MRRIFPIALCLLPLTALAASVEEKTTQHQTYSVSGPVNLTVDTIWGNIDIVATNGHEVRITAEKTLRADDSDSARKAREEVRLDLSQSGDTVRAYVDGPFRCHCENGGHGHREDVRYVVQYDFHIEVPAQTAVDLHTVNDGRITVRGTSGAFKVSNVNGGIEMTGIGGAGKVHTINGTVHITFVRNPAEPSSFVTLNGDVDVTFLRSLSADAKVKTFNGDVFTDFEVMALPRLASAPSRKNGHFVYRSNDGSRFRIGSGGPELEFETFNGSIKIRSRS